jgi:hypothetical protein
MQTSSVFQNFTAKLFLLVCLVPVSLLIYKKPQYNADILAYMALAVNMDHKDIQDVHRITYQSARENMPADAYQGVIHSDNGLAEKMVDSPLMLYNRLPFYVIKPVYNLSVYAAYKAGVPLPRATIIPGILAFLLTGLLLFHWLRKYLSFFYAFAASLLLMHSPFMVQTAGISSPDTLSAFALFCVFYFIAGKRNLLIASLCMLLAVFIRMDNVVTAVPVLVFLSFTGEKEKRLPRKWLLVMLAAMGVSFLIITGMAASFGWNRYFYPSFLHYMSKGFLYRESFSMLAYLELMFSRAVSGIVFSFQTVFALLVLLMVMTAGKFRLRSLAYEQKFALLLTGITLMRFLVFPDISDRFYTAFYLCIAVLFTRQFASMLPGNAGKNDRPV